MYKRFFMSSAFYISALHYIYEVEVLLYILDWVFLMRFKYIVHFSSVWSQTGRWSGICLRYIEHSTLSHIPGQPKHFPSATRGNARVCFLGSRIRSDWRCSLFRHRYGVYGFEFYPRFEYICQYFSSFVARQLQQLVKLVERSSVYPGGNVYDKTWSQRSCFKMCCSCV